MNSIVMLAVLAGASLSVLWAQADAAGSAPSGTAAGDSVHAFTVKNIDGQDVPLSKYRGDVLLIVNVASR